MNELFFHECRAAGLVFKTSDDWFKWLTDNSYDIKKPVAEHEGFKYTIKDFCINPHVIEYSVEGADNWGWKVTTAKTQFGWIWGFSIQNGKTGYESQVGYPSRYDTISIFYGSEAEAVQDALTYIIVPFGEGWNQERQPSHLGSKEEAGRHRSSTDGTF